MNGPGIKAAVEAMFMILPLRRSSIPGQIAAGQLGERTDVEHHFFAHAILRNAIEPAVARKARIIDQHVAVREFGKDRIRGARFGEILDDRLHVDFVRDAKCRGDFV